MGKHCEESQWVNTVNNHNVWDNYAVGGLECSNWDLFKLYCTLGDVIHKKIPLILIVMKL
jgi:hypothetical protein